MYINIYTQTTYRIAGEDITLTLTPTTFLSSSLTLVIVSSIVEWRQDLHLVPPQPVGVPAQPVPRKLCRRVAIIGLTVDSVVSI